MKRAPITCRAGISRGKLKGVMRPTGPKGHLYPLLCWPGWSPDCPNDLAANLTYIVKTIVRFWGLGLLRTHLGESWMLPLQNTDHSSAFILGTNGCLSCRV